MGSWRLPLLSTVICGALMALSAPAAAGAANPKGPWTVGPINAKSSSGLAYCSMKNDYDNKGSLVFARDAAGSNSIAIDLGDKKLTAGAQYAVSIDVGMLTRQNVAVAATENVMIVQMGVDDAFYDMLRRKDVMQVSFKDSSLGFGLDGSAEALQKLSDCARDLAAGKTAANVTVDLVPQPAEPEKSKKPAVPASAKGEDISIGKQALTSSLQDEIDRLRVENRRLLQENQDISRELTEPGADDPALVAARKERKKLQDENRILQQNLKMKKQQQQQRLAAVSAPEDEDVNFVPAPPSEKVEPLMLRVLKTAQIPAMLSGLSDKSRVYTWHDGVINGGAVQDPLPAGQGIADAVDGYIARAESGCQGDFAHKLSAPVRLSPASEMMTGEMACIDGKKDTGAALLYLTGKDGISVIMLNAPTDKMIDALEKRDAIAATATGIAKDE